MKRKSIRLLPEKAIRKWKQFWNALYDLFRPRENTETTADFDPDIVPDEGAFLCTEATAGNSASVWEERNVMVGSLRTYEQLNYTLQEHRYYAPDRFLPSGTDHVRFIALHEEGIGTEPGIRLWGEVVSVRSLPRRNIPVTMRPETDPGELYREYTVKEWMPLPHPIRLLDTYRGRPQFTTEFLLKHCTRSYQLFVLTAQEDLELMRLLNRIFEEVRNEPALQASADYPYGEICFHRKDGMLTATDRDGYLPDSIPMDWLSRHPRTGFIRLKRMLNKQTAQN